MNMMNNIRKALVFLAVNSVFCASAINASEWRGGFEQKSDLSKFDRPLTDVKNRQWVSGSSFNEENRVRYSPKVSKNPWKPVHSSYYKRTFGVKRPWGNVPDHKPEASNMKLHDQRFKQWIHQQGSAYASHPAGGAFPSYGLPGSMYNDPLITPSIYFNPVRNTVGYGGYPGMFNPYTGLQSRPWR